MSHEPEATEHPPVRVGRRIFLLVVGLFLCVIAFALGRWWFDTYQTAGEVDRLFAALDKEDPGWRLDDLLAARPEPPAGQNSAEVCVAVAKMVPGSWPYWDSSPEFAELRFDSLPVPNLLDDERKKMLDEEMPKVAAAVTAARRLATMPNGKHKLEVGANPLAVPLTDQQDTRRSSQLLRYEGFRLANNGDANGTLLLARASINAGRSLDDEPVGVSQLIRISCVAVGLSLAERALALGVADDADLAELQKLLRLEAEHPTGLVVMRGERAVQGATLEAIQRGKVSPAELFGLKGGAWYTNFLSISPLHFRQQSIMVVKYLNEAVEIAKLPPHEQFSPEAELETKVNSLPVSNALVRQLLPAIGKMNAAWRRKLGQVRSLDALLAAERYRLKFGKWPEKLADIPREMLPELPLDPYDGAPVRYKRTDYGVVVYVLGDNRKDDGGDVTYPVGRIPADWGYRLWEANKRRLPPPPPRAEAEK